MIKKCKSLEKINVLNDQCIIGPQAFEETAWLEAQPDGVVYVGRCLYLYKGALPKGSTVEVREGTVAISSSAFQDCTNLKNILIPNSVTTIGESAFNSTGLESIILPEKLDTLERWMFWKCTNLISVRLPDHLSSIAEEVFKYCSALESVVIPASVTSIGGMAFSMMDKIKSVTSLSDTPCTVSAYVFSKISKNAVTLYIPTGTKDAYIAAGWDKGFSQIVEKNRDELETGIHSPSLNSKHSSLNCYDLSGRRLSVPSASSVRSVLPKGVYIEDGKKRVRK